MKLDKRTILQGLLATVGLGPIGYVVADNLIEQNKYESTVSDVVTNWVSEDLNRKIERNEVNTDGVLTYPDLCKQIETGIKAGSKEVVIEDFASTLNNRAAGTTMNFNIGSKAYSVPTNFTATYSIAAAPAPFTADADRGTLYQLTTRDLEYSAETNWSADVSSFEETSAKQVTSSITFHCPKFS